jgi:carbon monoxide dehydrogenase subunit G
MELKATYVFDASVAGSWDLLMDTKAIAHCLPGCRELRPTGDDRYEVELTVALAAIAGDFKGTVALKDKMPPDSYTLVVEGSGRQGFVKGHAVVSLEADGDRTLIHVAAQADVGGKIARIGQRMLDGVTRATMKRFYRCLAKQISQPGSTYDPQEEMETEREKEIDEA